MATRTQLARYRYLGNVKVKVVEVALAAVLIVTNGLATLTESVRMEADGLKMSKEDSSQQTAPPGGNITFSCVVSGAGYNYFYHQVVWHKVMGDGGDDMQINTGAIINPPFHATWRYAVEPDVAIHLQLVSVPLIIKGVTLADNGTYRCDLMTTGGVIDSVTHTLTVTVPVDEVVLFINKTTTSPDQVTGALIDSSSKLRPQSGTGIAAAGAGSSTQVFELAEFEPAFVSCQSTGGHPAPELRVFQGDEDISGDFTRHEVEVTRTGTRGFEVTSLVTRLTKVDYAPSMEVSRKSLRCVADIPHQPELRTEHVTEIRVRYAPFFQCDHTREAPLHFKNYKVDCKVKANPSIDLGSVAWIIGDQSAAGPAPSYNSSSTLLRNGDAWNGYSVDAWRHPRDPEVIHTTLTIDTVEEAAYQTYGVRVKNALEERKFLIRLNRVTKVSASRTTGPPSTNNNRPLPNSSRDQAAMVSLNSGAGHDLGQWKCFCVLLLLLHLTLLR